MVAQNMKATKSEKKGLPNLFRIKNQKAKGIYWAS
jgi:hypothetical protein